MTNLAQHLNPFSSHDCLVLLRTSHATEGAHGTDPRYCVTEPSCMIGSGPGATLKFDDSWGISPAHAEVVRVPGGGAYIRCLADSLMVNGQPATEAWLQEGDQLVIGRLELLVEQVGAREVAPIEDLGSLIYVDPTPAKKPLSPESSSSWTVSTETTPSAPVSEKSCDATIVLPQETPAREIAGSVNHIPASIPCITESTDEAEVTAKAPVADAISVDQSAALPETPATRLPEDFQYHPAQSMTRLPDREETIFTIPVIPEAEVNRGPEAIVEVPVPANTGAPTGLWTSAAEPTRFGDKTEYNTGFQLPQAAWMAEANQSVIERMDPPAFDEPEPEPTPASDPGPAGNSEDVTSWLSELYDSILPDEFEEPAFPVAAPVTACNRPLVEAGRRLEEAKPEKENTTESFDRDLYDPPVFSGEKTTGYTNEALHGAIVEAFADELNYQAHDVSPNDSFSESAGHSLIVAGQADVAAAQPTGAAAEMTGAPSNSAELQNEQDPNAGGGSVAEVLARMRESGELSFTPDSAPAKDTSKQVPATTARSSPAETGAGHATEDVNDYMAQLLRRLNGGAAAPDPVAPVVAVEKPAKPVRSAPVDNTIREEDLKPADLMREEDFVPKTSAPEKNMDLAAMRMIANQSTKAAIQKSTEKKTRVDRVTWIAGGVSCLAISAVLFSMSSKWFDMAFLAACVTAVAAVFIGYLQFSPGDPSKKVAAIRQVFVNLTRKQKSKDGKDGKDAANGQG